LQTPTYHYRRNRLTNHFDELVKQEFGSLLRMWPDDSSEWYSTFSSTMKSRNTMLVATAIHSSDCIACLFCQLRTETFCCTRVLQVSDICQQTRRSYSVSEERSVTSLQVFKGAYWLVGLRDFCYCLDMVPIPSPLPLSHLSPEA